MQVLDIVNSPYNGANYRVRDECAVRGDGQVRCMKFADEAIQEPSNLNDTKRIVLSYQRALIRP